MGFNRFWSARDPPQKRRAPARDWKIKRDRLKSSRGKIVETQVGSVRQMRRNINSGTGEHVCGELGGTEQNLDGTIIGRTIWEFDEKQTRLPTH